jgi:hypothetical protein
MTRAPLRCQPAPVRAGGMLWRVGFIDALDA